MAKSDCRENIYNRHAVDTSGNVNTSFINATASTDRECKKWPKIMITFDDGYQSVYTTAYPTLNAFDYDATVYVIEEATGRDYLSEEQQIALYQDNWDIANHGQNHTPLTYVNAALQKAIIQDGQRSLSRKGFNRSAYHLAYPFGNRNDEVISSAEEVGTLTARKTLIGILFIPKRSGLLEMNISSYIRISTSVSSVESTISEGTTNQTMVLLFHRIDNVPGIYNWSPSKFADLTNWIYDQGYDTITVSEWYSLNSGF